MLLKCCTQYVCKSGKPSSDHRTGRGQSASQFPRAVSKSVHTTGQLYSSPMLERSCSKSCMLTSAYVHRELPYVQAGFRKDPGTRDQITSIHWIIEKTREFQKNIYIISLTMLKSLTVLIIINCGKLLKR